jgi:hypothetical protein
MYEIIEVSLPLPARPSSFVCEAELAYRRQKGWMNLDCRQNPIIHPENQHRMHRQPLADKQFSMPSTRLLVSTPIWIPRYIYGLGSPSRLNDLNQQIFFTCTCFKSILFLIQYHLQLPFACLRFYVYHAIFHISRAPCDCQSFVVCNARSSPCIRIVMLIIVHERTPLCQSWNRGKRSTELNRMSVVKRGLRRENTYHNVM